MICLAAMVIGAGVLVNQSDHFAKAKQASVIRGCELRCAPQHRPRDTLLWRYAALTLATKAFTSLDSCSACFDRSDAAVRT
jgi:hypothetical protein